MTQETMTVHQALCDIKVADKRIQKLIGEFTPVTTKKHSSIKAAGVDVNRFNDEVKAQYQKITDIVKRTNAIKAALNQSNASTVIRVGDKEMSVAEAIYMSQHGIENLERIRDRLAGSMNKSIMMVENVNDDLDEKCDSYIKATFGNKDAGVDPAAVTAAREAYMSNNELELVDPLGAEQIINRLTDEIDEFTAKVDAALQASNATRTITIEY